jgi:hypothetical protein
MTSRPSLRPPLRPSEVSLPGTSGLHCGNLPVNLRMLYAQGLYVAWHAHSVSSNTVTGGYHSLCYVAGSGSGIKPGVDDRDGSTRILPPLALRLLLLQTAGAGNLKLVPKKLALSVAAAATGMPVVLSKY